MIQEVFSLLRPHEGRRRKAPYQGLSSLLATSQSSPDTAETVGVELRRLVDTLARSGRELESVAAPSLAGHIRELLDSMVALSCRIAVVGQVKAGKSSFINALIQRGDLLPTHVNPWTAVATRLHFGTHGKPMTGSDFTFFTAEEWEALGRKAGGGPDAVLEDGFEEMKRRAEVRLGEQFHHLLGKAHYYQSVQPGILQNYLCAGPPVEEMSREVKPGRYADITKTANVYFPLPPMAVPAIVIDTPGTNDPTHLRHRITREIIEGADIYIVVITARQALAGSDLVLLELLRELEKQRIIVFINRIDELNERAADAELVVRHVRDQLARVFPDVAIPVIAGSARWAGLATGDDAAELREQTQGQAFQAVAAQRRIAIPTPEEQDGDLPALRAASRSASGLHAVARLLSLFMLSGFVSNHARGVASVLVSAADICAANACRQLQAIAQQLYTLHENPALGRDAADKVSALVVEINAFLDSMVGELPRLKEVYLAAIRQDIARLEGAVETDIRSFAHQFKPAAGDPAAASEGWAFDGQPARFRPEEAPGGGGERSSWLASVKQATFGLLRKARAEAVSAPQQQGQETEKKPAAARATSLTVPVTAGKDVSMDSGGAWWSDGVAGSHGADGAAANGAVRSFAATSLEEVAEEVARTGGPSAATLPRLISRFRALQAEAARDGQDAALLCGFTAEWEGAFGAACHAIVVHEKATRQVKGVFEPKAIAG